MPLSLALELQRLSLERDGRVVLHNTAMQIARGCVVALLGPSGCGKTTLLRVIAGLEKPSSGVIYMDGNTVFDERCHCAPEKRRTGLVFQDLALFPNCTVAWHIRFGLGGCKDADARFHHLLELTSLGGLAKRYPHQLSTGQRQRVALARALAAKPRLMLLDEPFANLDAPLRTTLADETIAILREAGIATLMVTHDCDEACSLADQINLMRDGKLLQTTPPDWFRRRPYSASLAGLGGYQGFVRGTINADGTVATPLGNLHAALPGAGSAGAAVTLVVGCDDLHIENADGDARDAMEHELRTDVRCSNKRNAHRLSGEITYRNFHAGKVVYTVCVPKAGTMYCLGEMNALRNIGDTVHLRANMRPLTVTRGL